MRLYRGERRVGGTVTLVDRDGEHLVVTYYRPSPRARLDIAPDFQALEFKIARFYADVSRYDKRWDDEPPKLVITQGDLMPLVRFIQEHTKEAGPFTDPDTDEPIAFDSIKPNDYIGGLLECPPAVIANAVREMRDSGGMWDMALKRLSDYVALRADGGCRCERCIAGAERDEHCKLEPLEPLHDLHFYMAEYKKRVDGDALHPDTPLWLEQVHEVMLIERVRQQEREELAEKQRKVREQIMGTIH